MISRTFSKWEKEERYKGNLYHSTYRLPELLIIDEQEDTAG